MSLGRERDALRVVISQLTARVEQLEAQAEADDTGARLASAEKREEALRVRYEALEREIENERAEAVRLQMCIDAVTRERDELGTAAEAQAQTEAHLDRVAVLEAELEELREDRERVLQQRCAESEKHTRKTRGTAPA